MIMMMIIIHGSNISFTIRSFLISSEALHRHRNKNTGPSNNDRWSWVMTQFHAPGFKNLHAPKTDNDCTFILSYFSVLFVLVSHTKTPRACLQKYNVWQITLLCQKYFLVLSQHDICSSLFPEQMQIACIVVRLQALLHCFVFSTLSKGWWSFSHFSSSNFFFSEFLTFLQGAALPFQPLYFPKRMSQFGQ